MPLITLDGATAWNNVFAPSGSGIWPKRDELSCLERFGRPEFTPGFTIPAGAKIFTIGSCFARTIESELARRGFDVPAVRHFDQRGRQLTNLYHPRAMLQQVRWGLGLDRRPSDDERLIHIAFDHWIDPHLHFETPTKRAQVTQWPAAWERLQAEMATAEVFVVTLGFLEAWYDTELKVYINEPFHYVKLFREDVELQRHFARRFRFELLSFAEAYRAVRDVLLLLREHCGTDARVVLTVSPVPIVGSFSGQDVTVANMQSKATLRAVAGEICAELDFVDYFPSYEMVMLAPAAEALQADGIHVRDEVVAAIVQRLIDAYYVA